MKKLFLVMTTILLTIAMLSGSVGAALASNGAYTWQNLTDTFVVQGSCSDPDGVYQITVVSSGAIHYVENDNGYKFSWAENAEYFIEPIDANSPVTYSGRYTTQLQENLSNGNNIFKNTFTNVGLGSDGTHETFHLTFVLVVTPNGLVREADNLQWICN